MLTLIFSRKTAQTLALRFVAVSRDRSDFYHQFPRKVDYVDDARPSIFGNLGLSLKIRPIFLRTEASVVLFASFCGKYGRHQMTVGHLHPIFTRSAKTSTIMTRIGQQKVDWMRACGLVQQDSSITTYGSSEFVLDSTYQAFRFQ
jgi:hypothetical protein